MTERFSSSPQALIGRVAEQDRLTGLLNDVRAAGTAVLVEGAAGIGKTALVRTAAESARALGFQELAARGARGAEKVGYSGLHQLLHPVLGRAVALPDRQRSALMIAFGREDGPAPDRLLISLATLGLLEEVASIGPLLAVVDDLHWLDRSSADVVSFLGRRLDDAPVLLLATTRGEPYPDRARSFPHQMSLSALPPPQAMQLLRRRAPQLQPRVRQRILELSAGNPLALYELPAVLGETNPVDGVPMTDRLEQAFLAEAAELPQAVREALLVAAADQDAPADELVGAIGRLGSTGTDLTLAERAGLLTVEQGRAVFRHPLVASAVYGAASSLSRSRAHRALAAVATDSRRAAWHQASATPGWDEKVAARLEDTGLADQRHGANPEAMNAFRRAAELSPAPGDRMRRLRHAAEAARRGGLTAEAVEILREALPQATEPADVLALARTEWLLSMTSGVPGRSALELVELARRENGPGQVEVLLWAATKAWVFQEPNEVRVAISAAFERVPAADRGPLHGVGLTLLDPIRNLATFRADLRRLTPWILDRHAEIMNVLAFAAEGVQNLETAEWCWTTAVEHHHMSGRIADEAVTLCGRATPRMVAGSVRDGLQDAQQALRLAREFDLPIVGAMAAAAVAHAHAVLGANAEARSALEQMREFPGGSEVARVRAVAAWATGLIALNEGRHPEALQALEEASANELIGLWAGADLLEAAIGARQPQEARSWLEKVALYRSTGLLGQAWERAQAQLADGDDAREHFQAAIHLGERRGEGLDLGRTRLLFGGWLRRRRQVAEARLQLTEALTLLRGAGARAWAARAEAELIASGVRVPAQVIEESRPSLTVQEDQIAHLAAEGLTDREIADQLLLSHRTVAHDMNLIIVKLGLSDRSELAETANACPGDGG
ncbi:ATP-binding protein [Paractinoplanes atraurantiacus]|uniref:Regulatory protein, luxR family n=1 Tax=Paractinoplanes atraurantiacus TaxID=1036182 RepID=A0A285II69_9ACTN|nr:LuxR family transcriptional regulator [Actinoplanes atraurantiacus]SNY47669.1 regulatory protein, luxR family [Actinoplanes atraurantiacus]